MLSFKRIKLFSGFYSREVLSEHSSFSKGSKSMSMDGNIMQWMSRIVSDIPTIQYFFERILETSYVMPTQKYLSTKLYSDSALSRIFPDVHNPTGFCFPNAIDWIKLFWAIFISKFVRYRNIVLVSMIT